MSFKIIIETLVALTGIGMSIGYYPQAYKIWKTKSAKDISIFTYAIFGIGNLIWTAYGIYLSNIAIILGFVVGVIGAGLVFGLTLHYRHKNR